MKSILEVSNLPTMEKRRQSLLSGLRRTSTTKSQSTYSKSIIPSEVKRVQVVVGGDHGDTAFQFGASVSVDLIGDRIIDFEVTVCELICQKKNGQINRKDNSDTTYQRSGNRCNMASSHRIE